MAVDSAAKRYSMISFGGELFGMRVPDATDMDEAVDRQNEVYLYAGFDAGAPPAVGEVGEDRRRRSAVLKWRLRRY